MTVFYVAGKYRGPDKERNIKRAAALGGLIRSACATAIVPHLESIHNEQCITEDEWLEHGIELMCLCDYVAVVPNSEESEGTRYELEVAEQRDIRALDFDSLCDVLRKENVGCKSFDELLATYKKIIQEINSTRRKNKINKINKTKGSSKKSLGPSEK